MGKLDHTGKILGKYKVIERAGTSEKGIPLWKSICECGKEEIVPAYIFRSADVPMCRECREREYLDSYIGKKYGKLTIVERTDKKLWDNTPAWKCICECGNIKYTTIGSLTTGRVISCGCAHKEASERRRVNHSDEYKRLHDIWCNMRSRCRTENNPQFMNYGGRGISVCPEWNNSFKPFLDWALKNGYSNDLSIDRIDVNGNYEPSNCRWTTGEVQQNNRRNNLLITMNNETRTMAQWARLLSVTKKKIEYHYHKKGERGAELYNALCGGG